MPLSYSLANESAERILVYRLTAPDLAPRHTDHPVTLRPSQALVTYTSRDGAAWVIDSIDISGLLMDEDWGLSLLPRRQRYHVEPDPLTVATEFRTEAPGWLRDFAAQVLQPRPRIPEGDTA